MSMTFMHQLGIIPAVLIALAALLIVRMDGAERSAARLLLFSLGLGVLLLSALLITMHFITEPYDQPFFQLSRLLLPSLLGLTALILLNLKALAHMDRRLRTVSVLLGLAMMILVGLFWNTRLAVEYLVLPGALILAVGWSLGRRYGWLAAALYLLCLGVLVLLNYFMGHPPDYSAGPPPLVIRLIYLFGFNVWPALGVVMSGLLVAASLQPSITRDGEAALFHTQRGRLIALGSACILILYMAYVIFRGSLWDQTQDGLFGLFISQQSALIASGTGMLMTIVLRGRHRLAGLAFTLIVPLLLYQSFEAGWRASYHEITEERAARIARALDRFQAREGHYPASLDVLTPRDLLFLQQPAVLAGEEWCYQGGEDYYRLAAFHREFFSAPVSLKVYQTAGEPPEGPLPCEERLAAMKERYYSPMEDPAAMQPPVPTPLPEVEVGVPKMEVQPLLGGAAALAGSWSPDSSYFVFGTQAAGLALQFLDGETGDICTTDVQFSSVDRLREQHAWLPDGRLLVVDPSGETAILVPCQPGAEVLTVRFPQTFDQIAAYAPENGRVLLQSEDAYWILDGRTLELLPIPEVTPNPYDLHWDRSAWLPGGESLVIARLNGRKGSNEGVELFLVDGGSGTVQKSHLLKGEYGQSAPWLEGLGAQELLLHGQGELLVMDFSADPLKITNVLKDIFGLDVRYPDEMSAAGSHVKGDGSGYSLVVRLNHPRNQATYLYDSGTERVYVYDHEGHTLVLFPDGYRMEMAKQEDVPSYTDEYDILMVDRPEAVHPRLRLEGHTPREYPHLSFVYLERQSQLAVASAHGVSLVSLPGGEMQAFWSLPGDGYSPWLTAAPDGSALIASKDVGGLYFIPLPPGG
jgi:hypothetical protein